MSLNLVTAILDKIEAIGVDAAAAYFKDSKSNVDKWAKLTLKPTAQAAQIILDEALSTGAVDLPVAMPAQGNSAPPKPAKAQEVRVQVPMEPAKAMEKAKKFSLLTPINREIPYATVHSMLGQWKATLPPEIREMLSIMDFEPDTTPHMARNRLAMRFLDRGAEWSFWIDSDMIVSVGNPGWMKRRTGMKWDDKWFKRPAIEQLTSRGKTICGAVYPTRSESRGLVAMPLDGNPKPLEQKLREYGPHDAVAECRWIGFGCIAVHRQVYLDILEKVPGVKSENPKEVPHDFFTPTRGGNQGEDIAFLEKAREAGHSAWLDLSVFCGHIGRSSFSY